MKKKIDPATIPPFCTNYDPYPQGQEHRSKVYEDGASKYWNYFYSLNKRSFFKDRHWILREFNELESPPSSLFNKINQTNSTNSSSNSSTSSSNSNNNNKLVVLDLGCGVGNALFPLLEKLTGDYFFYACDFSSKAVNLLNQSPLFDKSRVVSFVCDLVKDNLSLNVPNNSAHFAILIFVLSAIAPEHYDTVIAKIFNVLAPGGIVFVRDYGRGDLAQKRLAEKQDSDRSLANNFYVRGDGTRAYYFELAEISSLFKKHGFIELQNEFVKRTVENRKQKLKMERTWFQSKFQKPPSNQ